MNSMRASMKWMAAVVLLAGLVTARAEEKKEEDPRVPQRIAAYKEYDRLYKEGNYSAAFPFAVKVVELSIAIDGRGSRDHATSLNNLAVVYQAMGEYTKAEPIFQSILALREKKLGRDHLEVANSLNNLAGLYKDLAQYAKAEPLYQRSLAIIEKQLGQDHAEVAASLNNLAVVYNAMGQFASAEPLFKRSLAIYEKQSGPDHPDVGQSLNNLASLYYAMSQYAVAEPLFRRGLAIYEKHLGPDHPEVATNLNNLALLYYDLGQFAKAEPLFQRSLRIREKQLGSDHPLVAASLSNLAALYCDMGQYAKSEPLFQRSLTLYEKLEPDHPGVATSLNNLAALYQAMDQHAKAEPLLQRSLAIYEKQLGPDHPSTAASLNNLAALYQAMNEFAKAEPLFQRSLAIREKQLGTDHPDVANSLNNLAALYKSTGQRTKAEPLYQRSRAICENQLGPDHPNVADSLNNLAGLYAAQSDWKQALVCTSRALRIQHRHMANVLPFLSESEQAAFLRSVQRADVGLSFGLHASEYPPLAPASAEWLLNGKGLLTEVRSERARLTRQTLNTAAAELGRKLSAVRSMLSQAQMSTLKPGEEAARFARLRELLAQDETLSKELGQALGTEFRKDSWVSLEEFRKKLPPKSVFIDIARFDEFNFSAAGGEKKYGDSRYVAWLIFPEGSKEDVAIIPMGDAKEIDAAVAAFRTVSEQPQNGLAIEHLKTLASKILQPLETKIGSCERWLISPDGALWLVPWAALPTSNGKLAVEEHTIQYLVSGREWVAPRFNVEFKAPAILADPDFDLGLAKDEKRGDDTPLYITRSASLKGEKFKRLSGTEAEAKAIRAPLAALTKSEPTMWLRGAANKTNFFKLSCPKAIVMSTHGFFLDEEEKIVDLKTGERKEKPGTENPLLRCGLVLSGANNRESIPEGGDDGILSGLEIATADLRGTDLVVLSACETGLGTVHNGEGVAGLRQCFQLAGAATILATLWHVEDKASVTLMTDFFNNIAAGQDKPTALRNAQLKMIKALKEEGQSAHPFYWAAMTSTGK